MSRWYRAYAGTISDTKLSEVSAVAEASRSVTIAVWHGLLESAAECQDGGRFDTNARRLAAVLGEPVALITAVLAAFAEVGMVDGCHIGAWKRRQFESDISTERSRKLRERRRNGDATLQQRRATPPETETETETEISSLRSDERVTAPPPVKAKKATRLSPDWQPAAETIAYAVSQGFTEAEARRLAEKFKNYWIAAPAKNAVKLDWPATWRNWVLREAEDKGRSPPPERSSPDATLADIPTLAKLFKMGAWGSRYGGQPGMNCCGLPAETQREILVAALGAEAAGRRCPHLFAASVAA